MIQRTAIDDNDIVAMYFERNEDAIRETESKYEPRIFSICNNILRQRQDSEECVNTVYKKLWDSIPPERPGNFKAFIARIARNAATDLFRANGREKRNSGVVDSLDDYADFLEDDYSVEDEVCVNELAKLLNGFIKRLPERERACFMKRYYFNCKVDEIVKQTHIPKRTVYAILEKVKNELKDELSKEGYLC